MQQRVRKSYRGKIPSSSRQLPVPVALNAGSPTLSKPTIHERSGNVHRNFRKIRILFGNAAGQWNLSHGLHPLTACFVYFP